MAATTPRSTYDFLKDNVGPLTTVFTGPTTCLSTTSYVGSGIAGFYVAAFWSDVTECYPSGTQSLNLHTNYYYSPGICPSGWEPAVSFEKGLPTTESGYSVYKLSSGITGWLCCPTGYNANRLALSSFWFATNECASTIQSGQTMTNVWMTTDPTGSLSSIKASTNLFVVARGIPIMWQPTDSSVLDWWATASPGQVTATSRTGAPGTSTSDGTSRPLFGTISPSTTATDSLSSSTSAYSSGDSGHLPSNSDSESGSGGSGLSTGTAVGVGVGTGIGVIAIAIASYVFFRLRTKKRGAYRPNNHPTVRPHELAHNPVTVLEKSTWANTPEMATAANRHEMPVDQTVVH